MMHNTAARSWFAWVFVLLLSTTMSFAQGGSNFSALGIGDLRTSVGGVYDAMGGTTIAIPTPYSINVTNPALLGQATTTRIQVGYRFNQHVVSNETSTLRQNNGNLDGILAMFSIDTAYGFGISFGILPYSRVAYYTQRQLNTNIDGDVITGRSTQTGSGGVSQLHIGSSVRIVPGLQFGLSMGALFGVLTYEDEVTADGPFYSAVSTQSYDLRGLLFRSGLYWSPTSWLNVGAFVSTGGEGSVFITRKAQGYSGGVSIYDTTQVQESTTDLPLTFGFGVSTKSGRTIFGADVEMGQYNGMTINVRDDAGYSDAMRVSLGYSYQAAMSPALTFGNKIGYHAGVSYQQLYATYLNSKITEFSGGGGISFPLGGNAMVDAGLQIGYRAPQDVTVLDEMFGRLTVSISIGETWFKPFARD